MMKWFGLVVIVMLVVLGLGAPPSTLAQQEEWKTYISPEHKFTLDYPYQKSGDITFIGGISPSSDVLNTTIGNGFTLEIKPDNGLSDIKPYVEDDLHKYSLSNDTIVQNIHPVTYSNISGYEFVVYDGKGILYIEVFLHHGSDIYKFSTIKYQHDYSRDTFEQILNSLIFFD
ncbi:hypothetical protein [Candidatus Nitrosocosmicus franklandus]|uniref:PsbP C-terminal domain-containing protein n=1 Tax=Candidatus Nitrosocosmicus franklandianus TaxID=1798806 RepID=A0A484IEL0_9ARCH|nr:hypothetical protein [Candidatus Nitrosocosmicus franklandus]VFJ15188.1 exported protein of unknown function [Candidatus Nitrosocosmicus franklandus]